jgi:asparagine synthase (glutamine-hydrolysing)
MCGIGGIVSDNTLSLKAPDFLSAFQLLESRGPDNFEIKNLGENVVLAHARLSIIGDSSGNQPIQSICKRYWMVFNGEIYNYQFLRVEVLAYSSLRALGASDSEVLLEGFAIWGFDFFKKLRGMYAIGIYDSEEDLFYLHRDHFGIKPLYYFCDEDFMTFSSQPDVIASVYSKVRGVNKNVELPALIESFIFRGSSSPLFDGLLEVLPGQLLCFHRNKLIRKEFLDYSYNGPSESLASELSEAMRLHMVSDVPVGIFLSGGVDSSIIAQFAKPYGLKKAFTYKQEGARDESIYAQSVADSLEMDLEKVEAGINDVKAWLNGLYMPITDPSAVPILAISRHAKKLGYKVLLSGEGADEIFGGYKKYKLALLLNLLVGLGLRRFVCKIIKMFPLRSIFTYRDSLYFYGSSSPVSVDDLKLLFPNEDIENVLIPISLKISGRFNFIKDITNFEISKRLNYDLLRRSDVATMAASVECRVPFVDQNVVSIGRSLPYYKKFGWLLSSSKKLLRSELSGGLKRIVNRPKTGFEINLLEWLDSMEDYFNSFDLERRIDGLDYDYVGYEFKERANREGSRLYMLWAWLVVEMVVRKYQ